MRVLIATPLYPPEVAEPAPYAKELARRLAEHHEVTVVAYTHLPESVAGVKIVAVEKRRPLPMRLLDFTRALARAARGADVVYVMNGPSTELPALLVSLASRTPFYFGITDPAAHAYAEIHLLRHVLERLAFAHARRIIRHSPTSKPEILPLVPYPAGALADWERSWKAHLADLESAFTYAER